MRTKHVYESLAECLAHMEAAADYHEEEAQTERRVAKDKRAFHAGKAEAIRDLIRELRESEFEDGFRVPEVETRPEPQE